MSICMICIVYTLFYFPLSAGDDAPVSLVENPIRLVDGSSPYEGRVEILYKGIWGTICYGGSENRWDYTESHVVCRQMGFGPALTSK